MDDNPGLGFSRWVGWASGRVGGGVGHCSVGWGGMAVRGAWGLRRLGDGGVEVQGGWIRGVRAAGCVWGGAG